MEYRYYVYAFNTDKGRVTAALSCPDEETARRACRIALKKMKVKDGADGFRFSCIEINVTKSRVDSCSRSIKSYLRSLPPHGLTVLSKPGACRDISPQEGNFDIDELESAELETKKILSKSPQSRRLDIRFMRCMESATFIADSEPTTQPESTSKSKSAKTEASQKKLSKYEHDVEVCLNELVDAVLLNYEIRSPDDEENGDKKLLPKDIEDITATARSFSKYLKENCEKFKNTETKNIANALTNRSEAWKNRKSTLARMHGKKPPSLDDVCAGAGCFATALAISTDVSSDSVRDPVAVAFKFIDDTAQALKKKIAEKAIERQRSIETKTGVRIGKEQDIIVTKSNVDKCGMDIDRTAIRADFFGESLRPAMQRE